MDKLAGNVTSEVLPDRPSKEVFLCAADSLDQAISGIQPTSEHFGLFLLMDAGQIANEDLFSAAAKLISQGLVYLVAWGLGCSKVEDIFDEAFVAAEMFTVPDDVLMTTSHPNEPLSEALWFFLNCAFATEGYAPTCSDWIISPINNSGWQETIRADIRRKYIDKF